MRVAKVTTVAAALLVGAGTLLATSGFMPQQTSTKVYWMATIEVAVADLPAYHELTEREVFPLQERHGYHWVAAWQTIVGDIEEVIAVAEFESMDAYLRARQSLLASPEWAEASAKFGEMTRSVRTRLLTATPYSPLM